MFGLRRYDWNNAKNEKLKAARAIRSDAREEAVADLIVTSNLRDFPSETLSNWKVEVRHPDQFLIDILNADAGEVIAKLHAQAATIGRTVPLLLRTLSATVPEFAAEVGRRTK